MADRKQPTDSSMSPKHRTTGALLDSDLRAALPALYSQENTHDPLVPAHFFVAGFDWYPTEFDGDDEFFGFVVGPDVQCAELGYFYLSELEALVVKQKLIACDEPEDGGFRQLVLPLRVERDLHWRPMPLSEVRKRHKL